MGSECSVRIELVGFEPLVGDTLVAGLTTLGAAARTVDGPDDVDPAADLVLVSSEAVVSHRVAWRTVCAAGVRVVLLTRLDHVASAQAVREIGARGWLPIHLSLRDLFEQLTGVIAAKSRPGMETSTLRLSAAALTKREIDVLAYVAHGRDNTEIAEHLEISPHTVRSHVENILNKLEVNTRLAAVADARVHGLLADIPGPRTPK